MLIERGLITSGDVVAQVLPQLTSGLRAAGTTDPLLRQLYAAILSAFRRRRSLLLLDMQGQVKIEELPWVAAIEQFRTENLPARELARQTLEEVVGVTLVSFPHAILPNKLLQELRSRGRCKPRHPARRRARFRHLHGPVLGEVRPGREAGGGSNEGHAVRNVLWNRLRRSSPPPWRHENRAGSWLRRWQPKLDDFAILCAGRAGLLTKAGIRPRTG